MTPPRHQLQVEVGCHGLLDLEQGLHRQQPAQDHFVLWHFEERLASGLFASKESFTVKKSLSQQRFSTSRWRTSHGDYWRRVSR